jgi:mono/diheme cytochrome c family protein
MRAMLPVIGCLVLAGGCEPATEEIASTGDDLAARNVQVIGALQYNQTSSVVAYTNPPRYRAFSFTGKPGDQIEIWVRSPDRSGDAFVLLANSNLQDLRWNDNADKTTTDAHLVVTLPASPVFYICFRDISKRPANFTVQLIGPAQPTYADTRIAQADIDAGKYTTAQLNEFGDVIFNHTFTLAEGLGNALTTSPAGSGARPNGRKIHNGKFGGPDAVGGACATCHTQGGDDGGGLNANNIFQDGDGINLSSTLVRNPIALLGNGYLQELGNEMTAELQATRNSALASAKQLGVPITKGLFTKGIDFGSMVARPDGTVDTTGVRGVDADLVVKPFGWKGRVASLRRFVEGGFQVHFGMATDVLIAKHCTSPLPDVVGSGPDCHDPDADGVLNEITEGQLTAMAIYATLRQAPIRINPTDATALARVTAGEALFNQVLCTSCHRPTLTLNTAIHSEAPDLTGGAPFKLDLTTDVEEPRLAAHGDGTVTVELFSDLKRHDLGPALADPHPTFKTFPANQFITTPLWGVAVTAPYMHDGRAPTLSDAIAAHDGEAASSRASFQALSADDKQKVLEFLGTLTRDPSRALK